MTKKKIILVVGARPNFMKVAPVLKSIREHASDWFEAMLVHTGQHYDANMSDIFFSDLDMPQPDRFLGVGSGSHAEQTARVMIEMEKLFAQEQPDLVIVAGDVNSTLATAIVAAKAGIPLGHIESGLRSFDRSMPEEINRIVADEFSDLCFVTEPSGLKNLRAEGIPESRIFFVGNTMIDSVMANTGKAKLVFPALAKQFDIEARKYALVTLHRPSNVDDKENLTLLTGLFEQMQTFAPKIIFPVHPRTRKKLEDYRLIERVRNIPSLEMIDPIGYLYFLALQSMAAVVLTDSGGIQEETTLLGVPCITLRNNTERPVTIEQGTNEMTGLDMPAILALSKQAFEGKWKKASIPDLWDGKAGERILAVLKNFLT
ncbi:MAG: UDP-N-acetylglucosamine 2-epimerase (non-hydrolyzing) [Bacteroidota bacterium]|nr:UDP-N-acetylglucosamine 2-epimerase (non-hydrolyzing) [Bacteroidota bacterium]MDP4231241.1 UDP-N-acetylglucosamine 2-epimerase (non-hydrolyzing) [Bacteroidota bacterium]MDP4235302.1 UDP-N-acetylglucosamine 2-epimerase (non-hydrolyzing) [Bacteroidota bacterium]